MTSPIKTEMHVAGWPGPSLVDAQTGQMLAPYLEFAKDPWGRFRGLMLRRRLTEGSGLWLEPCSQVQTTFMRFQIDVVFVDREGEVRRVIEGLRPWRLSPWVRGARSAIELPAGSARSAGITAGMKVAVTTPPSS